MSITLAETEEDRQAAREFTLAHNGAPFCAADQPPRIIYDAIRSFPAESVSWIVARDAEDRIVGTLAVIVGAVPGFRNLTLCGAIEPGQEDAIASDLVKSVVPLIGGYEPGADRWCAVIAETSRMLPVILDAYGEKDGHCEVLPDPTPGCVRIEGRVLGLPWV